MDLVYQKMSIALKKWQDAGLLHVVYAILAEALLLGYLGFMGLFTIETLLPTFVTVHLSLTKLLIVLLLGSFGLAFLGRYLGIDFASGLRRRNPLLWIGIAWMVGILAISLYKFPPLTIPVIILGFLVIGSLFSRIFFGGKA